MRRRIATARSNPRSASAHATARVASSTQKRRRPPRASHGDRSALTPSDAVKISVGHGRATTAGDTAVASHLAQPSNWAPHELSIVGEVIDAFLGALADDGADPHPRRQPLPRPSAG